MADSYFGQFTVIRIDATGEREILAGEDVYSRLESDDSDIDTLTTDANGIIASDLLTDIDPDTKIYFESKSFGGRLYQETRAVQIDAFQNPCTLVAENLYTTESETAVCDIYLNDLTDETIPTVFIGSVKPGGSLKVPFQPLSEKTADIYKINRDASGQMSTSKFQQADKETITDATSRPSITVITSQIVGVATDKLLGRDSSGTGAAEQLGISSKFTLSSLTLDINEGNLTLNNIGGTLGISKGGTGQTTAANAINALLPSQSGNSGKYLTTNGSAASWATIATGITIGSTAITSGTDSRVLFQASGVVSQSANLTFDGSNNRLTVGSAILQTPNSTSLFLGTAPHASYSGSLNVFLGLNSGGGNTNQYGNVYIGSGAGQSVSGDAYFNTFVGYNAGNVCTGRQNTFFGWNAGGANTSGANNTFIGHNVGAANTTGANNTFVGIGAGAASTTSGAGAAFGYNAGTSQTTGSENAFFGGLAGYQMTTGAYNTFVGYRAGESITTASNNVFVGRAAGYSATGGNNTIIGWNAGGNITSGTDNCMIGYNVQADSATASSQTNINNTFIATSTEARISGRDFKIEDGKNIIFDTAAGTKIGTSTSQKLAFFGATPIVQPSAPNDIVDGISGTVQGTMVSCDDGGGGVDLTIVDDNLKTLLALLNQIKGRLEQLGLIAG